MELGTNPFWNGSSGTRGSLQSLPPRPCRSLGSSCGYSALTPAEKLGGQTMDCKSLGCQGPQGVSEPSSYLSHEFSPGFSGICPGRPERLQGGAIPTSQGPMPVPHLVQSSKLPFPRARTCCFSLTCFCPVTGSVTAWLHPRDLLGQGTSTPRAPRKRAVSNFYSFIRSKASQANSHT